MRSPRRLPHVDENTPRNAGVLPDSVDQIAVVVPYRSTPARPPIFLARRPASRIAAPRPLRHRRRSFDQAGRMAAHRSAGTRSRRAMNVVVTTTMGREVGSSSGSNLRGAAAHWRSMPAPLVDHRAPLGDAFLLRSVICAGVLTRPRCRGLQGPSHVRRGEPQLHFLSRASDARLRRLRRNADAVPDFRLEPDAALVDRGQRGTGEALEDVTASVVTLVELIGLSTRRQDLRNAHLRVRAAARSGCSPVDFVRSPARASMPAIALTSRARGSAWLPKPTLRCYARIRLRETPTRRLGVERRIRGWRISGSCRTRRATTTA